MWNVVKRITYGVIFVSTVNGNDQVRFELAFAALVPTMDVLAPWKDREFLDRFLELGYLDTLQIFGKLHGNQYFIEPDVNREDWFQNHLRTKGIFELRYVIGTYRKYPNQSVSLPMGSN